jgi:hypothetical protein
MRMCTTLIPDYCDPAILGFLLLVAARDGNANEIIRLMILMRFSTRGPPAASPAKGTKLKLEAIQ